MSWCHRVLSFASLAPLESTLQHPNFGSKTDQDTQSPHPQKFRKPIEAQTPGTYTYLGNQNVRCVGMNGEDTQLVANY